MMPMRILKSESGFTLIEALIAMVILTIGIMSLYTMQITAIKGNATANRLTTASTVAADCYERLLQADYNDATLDVAANPHDDSELTSLSLPAPINSLNWTVTEWTNGDGIDNDGDGVTDEGDETGIKLVDLSVNYTDKGVTKTMTVNFYKHGLL